MEAPEDVLAMAERHVREGEERVARQAALVARLAARGFDPTEAAHVLERLRTTLELMREHLCMERTKPPARPPAEVPLPRATGGGYGAFGEG